jgi:hypothetical protein
MMQTTQTQVAVRKYVRWVRVYELKAEYSRTLDEALGMIQVFVDSGARNSVVDNVDHVTVVHREKVQTVYFEFVAKDAADMELLRRAAVGQRDPLRPLKTWEPEKRRVRHDRNL